MTLAAQRRQVTETPEEIPDYPYREEEPIEFDHQPEAGLGNGADDFDICSAVGTGTASFGQPSRMVVKRSLSPDGMIDSVTVEIDLAIDGLSVQEIKAKGVMALQIETQITQAYFANLLPSQPPQPLSLVKPKAADNQGNGAAQGEELAVPARLLDIGKTRTNSYFINVKVGRKTARLFGSAIQLVGHLAGIGQDLTPEAISEGLQLDYSCRVITKLSDDHRYLNVVRLLPAA